MRSCNQQVCSENENEVQCQNGLEYFECGPCDSICGSNENCNTCAPSGCYCPKGLVFSSIRNETRCVPKTECGCIFKNKYQKPGSEVAITNCEVCVCQEGKLSHCKVKSDCHHEDPAICSWSSWGSWGPCFGPCGVNGIQWSFRSPAVPSVYGIGERCQGASKKSRRCKTSQCSFCHDDQGVTRMVGAQWRSGCTVCRCTKSGSVQCNEFCEFQLISNGCPANMTLVDPPDGCCFCSDGTGLDGDGIDGNSGSDGRETGSNDITPTCARTEFKCFDHSRCLPRENQCDGVKDCADGSDERFCQDCVTSDWTGWSMCSQTCGIGVRIKTRAVSIQNVDMKNCANVEFESVQPCQNRACPIDGYFEEWSTWSDCDRMCDGGLKKRKRFCHEPKNGGKSCSGTYVQVVSCNEHPCIPSEGCQGNKTLITDSCQSLCPATCAELSRQTDCVKKCSDETLEITGCFCTGNLLLQDGVCVTTDKCRCSHRGKELIPV